MTNTENLRKYLLPFVMLLIGFAYFSGTGSSSAHQSPYNIREVQPQSAQALIEQGAIVIDVRGTEQFKYRHIPGAILITVADLTAGLIPAELAAFKDRPMVVYCGDGVMHGPEGTDLLNKAGYTQAVNLSGGINAWEKAGMKVVRVAS